MEVKDIIRPENLVYKRTLFGVHVLSNPKRLLKISLHNRSKIV